MLLLTPAPFLLRPTRKAAEPEGVPAPAH